MRPLFAALARSVSLRELSCDLYYISADCARDVILPAVRANTSLRSPVFCYHIMMESFPPELDQAMRLVRSRQTGGASHESAQQWSAPLRSA